MKIAVLGCGAIGSCFLGYLKKEGLFVKGLVRSYQRESFLKDGLIIEGCRGNYVINNLWVDTHLDENVSLVIASTKINQLQEAIEENYSHIKEATIITTQNGIGAEEILSQYFPAQKIISGIVMFGATFYPPNKVVHNFEGELILGNIFGKTLENREKIENVLKKAFPVYFYENIKGAKYLKVFINLNNSIPACLGVSMQEAFADLEVAEVAIKLLKEAYRVVKESGITLESFPNYPKERVESLVNMPEEEAAKIFSQIMQKLSKEPLYGSILQSIKRGRRSEIDYINGAIVSLAKKNNLSAPLNKKIVEMVHRIEEGATYYTKEDFLKEFLSAYAKKTQISMNK